MCDSCEEGYGYAEGHSIGEEDTGSLGWIGLDGVFEGGEGGFQVLWLLERDLGGSLYLDPLSLYGAFIRVGVIS